MSEPRPDGFKTVLPKASILTASTTFSLFDLVRKAVSKAKTKIVAAQHFGIETADKSEKLADLENGLTSSSADPSNVLAPDSHLVSPPPPPPPQSSLP